MHADAVTHAEIGRVIKSMMTTFMTQDPDDYVRHLSREDDLIVIGSGANEIVRGWQATRAMLAEQVAEVKSIAMEFPWFTVSRLDNVAWASGELEFTAHLLDGGTSRGRPRYTMVFVRTGERWLGAAVHVSVADAAPTGGGGWWPRAIEQVASAVGFERPDLQPQAAPDGMVTLLFSDIESSTELNDELGDIAWMHALREHNAIIRERIAAHNGFEVKTIGDAFMVAFSSARRAVLCAVDLQRAFAARNDGPGVAPMRLRIGLHAGEPVREGDDFYGRSVVEASRIAGSARGGEILVSALLRELVESAGDLTFDGGRDVDLKGIAGPRRLYSVAAG
jgi:class 3 adenylate cyclase